MRQLIFPLLLTVLMIFILGCGEESIDASQIVERQEVAYKINSDTPFEGTVTSHHENGQLKSSGKYKKGKRVGKHTEYYDNGAIYQETKFSSSGEFQNILSYGPEGFLVVDGNEETQTMFAADGSISHQFSNKAEGKSFFYECESIPEDKDNPRISVVEQKTPEGKDIYRHFIGEKTILSFSDVTTCRHDVRTVNEYKKEGLIDQRLIGSVWYDVKELDSDLDNKSDNLEGLSKLVVNGIPLNGLYKIKIEGGLVDWVNPESRASQLIGHSNYWALCQPLFERKKKLSESSNLCEYNPHGTFLFLVEAGELKFYEFIPEWLDSFGLVRVTLSDRRNFIRETLDSERKTVRRETYVNGMLDGEQLLLNDDGRLESIIYKSGRSGAELDGLAIAFQKRDRPLIERFGGEIYGANCVACHQPGGVGMPPTFPAIKGGRIATGPIENHIDMILNGSKRNPMMAAWSSALNDMEIAAVITFSVNVLNSGNVIVTPEQIEGRRLQAKNQVRSNRVTAENEFSLSPLSSEEIDPVSGVGCGYYDGDDTYMFAGAAGRIKIDNEIVDLTWKTNEEWESNWRGMRIKVKILLVGKQEIFGEGPEGRAVAAVELQVIKGNQVRYSKKLQEVCGD